MFGHLKPDLDALDGPSLQAWHRAYCGSCASIGEHLGQAWRATLSHEVVVLALLLEGLQPDASAPSRCRCPLMPLHYRETLDEAAPSMRVAAATQALLVTSWLEDRRDDGAAAAAPAAALARRRATAARVALRPPRCAAPEASSRAGEAGSWHAQA